MSSRLFRLGHEVEVQQEATHALLEVEGTEVRRARLTARAALLDEAGICIAQARRAGSRGYEHEAGRRLAEALDLIAKALQIKL